MKKIISTILMTVPVLIFADQPMNTTTAISDLSVANFPVQETQMDKQGFFYVRFAAAERDVMHTSSVNPGLGIGYRRLAGNGAADISFSGIGYKEHKNGRVSWTAPKASYIHYLQPNEKKSAYVGGGLAWGGMKSQGQSFVGIIPSVTAGYEFAHNNSFLGFAEFNVSQPTISVSQKGSFPGPCLEFSTGIGF